MKDVSLGVGHLDQLSKEQEWGRFGSGQPTFPSGLLEFTPGSLYVALYQGLDDTKAVGPTLSLPRPCPYPRIGLEWKDRMVRDILHTSLPLITVLPWQ
jgi:hypothetical protein